MANMGHTRSDTKVVQGGLVFYENLLAKAAVTPGALVVRNTDDDGVAEAGANAADVLGVADIIPTERTSQTSREGQKVGTDIAQDQPCRVAKGIFLFRGLLASGQSVTKGQALAAAANGELKAAATGNPIVAYAEETKSTAGGILARFERGGLF